MATINPIFGRMKGKYGGSVMYSSNGKQCMRERVVEVANPRTSKQAIQRAIAATVAKFVSAFAPVLNNSLQSESTKVKTLAKIRSLNMTMLRQQAAQNLGTYAPKGSMYVAPNNYIISRGSLNGLTPANNTDSLDGGSLFFPYSEISVEEGLEATASQAFQNITVGDQITFLVSYMEDLAEGSQVGYCRFAFKDNTTPVFLANGENGFKLNPAAIDLTKAEGAWRDIAFNSTQVGGADYTQVFLAPIYGGDLRGEANMAGVIVSREAGKLRSNATVLSAANDEYTLAEVYPTYMDGGTPINMPSELYLNNDANAQG